MEATGRKFLARFDVDTNEYRTLVWGSVLIADDGATYRWFGKFSSDSVIVESLEFGNYGQTLHLPVTYFPNLIILTASL